MKDLIRRILKEEDLKQSLKQQIKDYGLKDAAELVGGIDEFLSIMNIKSPMEFLHLFDDLDHAQSKERKDWTLFRYKPKHNLMIYDRKNEDVYINYYDIWLVLEVNFELKYSVIQRLTQEWLSEVYNLRGVKTIKDVSNFVQASV